MNLSITTDTSTGRPLTWDMPASQGAQAAHAHSVQFYVDEDFLISELSRYIGSALGAGDAAIVIATRDHRNRLAHQLKTRGLNVDMAARQGRYVALDASETLSQFMLEGAPDEARFNEIVSDILVQASQSAAGEHPRIAAFGEMVALLWARGNQDAAIKLEELWNELASTHEFDLHCAYPIDLFSREEDAGSISKVCDIHSHVLPTENYSSLTDEGERLRAITLLQQKARALETEVEEHRKVQQSLRHAVASRDEFLSVAAHELKTPITSLRGFAQLLLRDVRRKREIPVERIEAALSAIETQTGKLNHLVARLLDSAQIKAGKLQIEPVKTDLVTLVYEVLAQQQADPRHEVVFEGPEHLEACVDPVRFEQVITNLVVNAIKFSPAGGKVTVQLVKEVDGHIVLSVTDEGLGIPNDQREKVFDRFQQSHIEHHLSGMGLGLYISREIVELHGGSIRIEQPVHSGTRFVVILPPSAENP